MAQWYLSYGGQQSGPFSEEEAVTRAKSNPDGHAWKEGLSEWLPISQVEELGQKGAGVGAPPPFSGMAAHDIDYKIFGKEMQFVEVELDPGESAVAEAGAMMYKDAPVQMETLFGDGSSKGSSGIMNALVGAGKRLLTGESLFITVFTHKGNGKGRVAFGAPFPGSIIPVSLKDMVS